MSFVRRVVAQNLNRAYRCAPRWSRTLTTAASTVAKSEAVVEQVQGKQQWKAAASFAAAGIAAASIQAGTSAGHTECAPSESKSTPTVVFVLGGPGAGKGTQCARIVEDYGFVHLSAGDLLRAHIKSGTKDGNMVAEMIKQGQIVPSEVTVGLLRNAMKESGKEHFLIDGFPRNEENRAAFEREMGFDCDFVLFFDCPEDVMEKRLLGRNEGRTDDNIETIRKRFKVFVESSMPVVQYYESRGKVRRVIADRSPEDVYGSTKILFDTYLKESALAATRKILDSIDAANWDSYKLLVDPGMTAYEPEAHGQLLEGTEFHQHMFKLAKKGAPSRQSVVSKPQVTLLGGGSTAVVTYNRLVLHSGECPLPTRASARPQQQAGWWHPAPPPAPASEEQKSVTVAPPTVASFAETRVFEKQKLTGKYGGYEWKCMHFHRSDA